MVDCCCCTRNCPSAVMELASSARVALTEAWLSGSPCKRSPGLLSSALRGELTLAPDTRTPPPSDLATERLPHLPLASFLSPFSSSPSTHSTSQRGSPVQRRKNGPAAIRAGTSGISTQRLHAPGPPSYTHTDGATPTGSRARRRRGRQHAFEPASAIHPRLATPIFPQPRLLPECGVAPSPLRRPPHQRRGRHACGHVRYRIGRRGRER